MKNFFRLLNDYGCKYGYKSCCGCLYYSCLCMVVFVIVHCLNMHDITPHGARAAVALISSLVVIQEGSPED